MSAHPLAAFSLAPRRGGLFLDFDGTLSEIASTPDGAVPRPGVPELLGELQRVLGRVVIVSGRPVAYLAPHIPTSVDIVGLYGLEWRAGGQHRTLDEAEEWRPLFRELTDEAVARFGEAVVEPKGLSLTIHYRSDTELTAPMQAWIADVAERTGAEGRPAKHSFEIHPPIRCDKGTAVVERASDLDLVAYIGDDLGDLPAFDGLDVLAERGVATVRVAVASDEVPPILLSRADHVVEGPAGAQALLEEVRELVASAPG
ncbi:MAG: trehalose-phosphatase [Acidimicrobiaceae bacterium]|jgi:trehalose 6-phosphate phosphatase